MIRRLIASTLVLVACAEHTPEYQDLLDKFGSETTSGSGTSTDTPTSDASTTTTGGSAGDTEANADSDDDTTTNTDDDAGQSSGDTTETSAGLPIDPPPTVTDLVCDPEEAQEVGPITCTYEASADVTVVELLDDGQVVATGPAGAPLIFPVISAPHNNPGSTITVRVRDEADQTAEDFIYHPSTVKDPGTEIWTKLEPNDGAFSWASAVALQGDHVIAAGIHWKNPLVVGTLRRYDKAGDWLATDDGWSITHDTWTGLAWMKTGSFGPTGLAVDGEGNIILVGLGFDNDQPRSYVARFFADGTLDWEKPGDIGTEARGVGVQPDGTIWVAGAKRTGVNPERWDMEVSVFGPDKTAYGPFPYSDPEDMLKLRSERGRAVVVLKNGNVVVVGEREVINPNDPNGTFITRGVAMLFEGKGKFLGEWTSIGDKLLYDAILAGVATDEGFATCGYTHTHPDEPGSKKQIIIRWHGEDLQEVKAPRLESTGGAAVCNALSYNMEGATIVGAQVAKNGQSNDQWIFAVEDAASLRVDYREHNGASNGDDRVQALVCEYKCAWVGAETVDGAVQWIAGLFRP
jgi:hypothetical protein